MSRSCTVIIPIYNAFEMALRCLESVARHSQGIARVLVIDDASPDGEFARMLPAPLRGHPLFSFQRNPENLGFVRTCNLGFEQAGDDDVVLLNSDTIVTDRFVEKLRQAAYSRNEVGTVTPLSNNATICSVPRFGVSNPVPAGYTVDEFAALVEDVSANERVELPTCIGFCVYIKRTVIDRIGGFDADAFGRGYGEENDFCCRARRAGFVDIVDDATFVYHEGNQSFGSAQSQLALENSRVLALRHPHYFDEVSRFCNRNPMRNILGRILDELVLRESVRKEFRVLHILQNGPHVARTGGLGGTELHVRDIIEEGGDLFHWSLVPTRRCYFLTAHLGGAGDEQSRGVAREYVLDLRHVSLARILQPEFFDFVHLHHSRYYDHGELCKALSTHGNYAVSFHDYILGCPRFHLYTPYRKVCNLNECTASCGYGAEYIESYRASARELLGKARKLFHFSQSTRRYVEGMLGEGFEWQEIPHGIANALSLDDRVRELPAAPAPGEPLRVAFLGHVPQHKGSLVAEELVKLEHLPNGTAIEWHVIGKLFFEAQGAVIDHGTYEREELLEKLRAARPHIVLILSICPETYCLTLDEAWNAGIPVICTPLGAPAERMHRSGAGWVLPEVSTAAVVDLLETISSDWSRYSQAVENLRAVKIRAIEGETHEYLDEYRSLLPSEVKPAATLLDFLRERARDAAPQVGVAGRVVGACINKAVYLLDTLGLRPGIQRAFNSLVPERLVRELKALR